MAHSSMGSNRSSNSHDTKALLQRKSDWFACIKNTFIEVHDRNSTEHGFELRQSRSFGQLPVFPPAFPLKTLADVSKPKCMMDRFDLPSGFQLIIKNTFVDIQHQETEQKTEAQTTRSSSCPPRALAGELQGMACIAACDTTESQMVESMSTEVAWSDASSCGESISSTSALLMETTSKRSSGQITQASTAASTPERIGFQCNATSHRSSKAPNGASMPKHDKTSRELTKHATCRANEEASTPHSVCKEQSLRTFEEDLMRCAIGLLKQQDPTGSASAGLQEEKYCFECIWDTDSSSDSSDEEVVLQGK